MRFSIKCLVSFWIVDHVRAFMRNLEQKHKSRPRLPVSRQHKLQANYQQDSGYQDYDNTNTNSIAGPSYSTGFNEPQPQPALAINYNPADYDGRPTYKLIQNNDGSQNYSYMQDWEVQGSGAGGAGQGASYLNQLDGSPMSAPGPSPQYLDGAAPASRPGVSSYADSLAPGDNMGSLYFLEKQQQQPQGAPMSTPVSSYPAMEVDPFSGFPVSAFTSSGEQFTPPSEKDAWYREMTVLKESVSSLSITLSSLSSQLASVVSAQTGPSSPLPTMAQIEEMIQRQFSQVVATQREVSKNLEASILELRLAMTKQDQSIDTIAKKGQEQGQDIANLRTSISLMGSKVQGIQIRREEMEKRLMALESRLSEQQQELRTASTRTDPRVIAVEARLEEQAELLRQAMTNPESRMAALESKISQLQRELLAASEKPEARVAALEAQWRDQQERLDTAKNQPDPRIAVLEAKMKVQEEQIREATAAISDARIAALRAKLTEQQEQFEATSRAREILSGPSQLFPPVTAPSPSPPPAPVSTDPTPVFWPFGSANGQESKEVGGDAHAKSSTSKESGDSNDGPSKWLPWNQSWKTAKPKDPERDAGAFARAPSPPPVPLVPEPPTAKPESVSKPATQFPWNNWSNGSAPAFGSYQSSPKMDQNPGVNGVANNGPPEAGSVGAFKGSAFGRGKGVTIETAPGPPPQAAPVYASSVPPPPESLTPPPPTGPVGAFQGLAFGRGKGITIETAPEQRPQSPAVPANTAPASFGAVGGRQSPIPPVASDQDRWDPDRPNPDAVKRPLIEFPKSPTSNGTFAPVVPGQFPSPPTMSSDQDRWERSNPAAARSQLDDNPNTGRRKGGVSSDQDQWDPQRSNPDVVKRPIIERKRNPPPSSTAPPASPFDNGRAPPKGSTADQALWDRGFHERGDGNDFPISAQNARAEGLPPISGVAADQANWKADAINPDAVNGKNPAPSNMGMPQQSTQPSVRKGVTSDQGRWDSGAQIKRDNEDLRATAAKVRPSASTQSQDADLFRKSQILSAYLGWCKNYGKEPTETRFENFSRNYARMEEVARQTGNFPALSAYADYSEEEFERINGYPGYR